MPDTLPPTPLLAVLGGEVRPYTRPGSTSAIDKQPLPGRVRVTTLGLAGDAQADLRVHGGPDKAIHHYPFDHYPAWHAELDSPRLHAPGAFGENLSTRGWTEHDVHFGDIVGAGTAVLQVSQARQPCWKLDDRFDHRGMARRVQDTGRTGWYYRVLQEGELATGDTLTLRERPFPDWPLSRLLDLLFHHTMLDTDTLRAASELPLPPSWGKLVRHRLEKREVESWEKRLGGPSDAQ